MCQYINNCREDRNSHWYNGIASEKTLHATRRLSPYLRGMDGNYRAIGNTA